MRASSHDRTAVAGPVTRVSVLRIGRRRCRARHFAAFLRRDVRCAYANGHVGRHAYRAFDEVVGWVADRGVKHDGDLSVRQRYWSS